MSSNIEPSIFTYFNQNSSNDRAIKALIGLTRSQFDILVPKFEAELHEIQMERVTNGEIKRLPSGGKSGFLHSIPLKLFFILFYLKNYPAFDVLAAIFMFSSGDAHGHVEKLFPVLERTLRKQGVLPANHVSSREDLLKKKNIVERKSVTR